MSVADWLLLAGSVVVAAGGIGVIVAFILEGEREREADRLADRQRRRPARQGPVWAGVKDTN